MSKGMLLEPLVIPPIFADDLQLMDSAGEPSELLIQCQVVRPESMAGRRALVRFSGEEVTALLRLARDAAIEARSQPMGGTAA